MMMRAAAAVRGMRQGHAAGSRMTTTAMHMLTSTTAAAGVAPAAAGTTRLPTSMAAQQSSRGRGLMGSTQRRMRCLQSWPAALQASTACTRVRGGQLLSAGQAALYSNLLLRIPCAAHAVLLGRTTHLACVYQGFSNSPSCPLAANSLHLRLQMGIVDRDEETLEIVAPSAIPAGEEVHNT